MFTGIIEETGKTISIGSGKLSVEADRVLEGLALGDSVAINGACLTVTSIKRKELTFNMVPETLKRTSLGSLKKGSIINLERALQPTSRMGGHMVQGHVEGVVVLTDVELQKLGKKLWFKPSAKLMRYIVEKGFVCLDGISLTVVDCRKDEFSVALIPYTLKNTNLGSKNLGDKINIETDIFARYVEKLNGKNKSGVTWKLLENHGFIERPSRGR
ncbi:MAG: riboflavin synthase [Dehalococcoidia bacterium]|nr:riboflavin synthase [Dehalococcoidia bacterium]